MHTSLGDVPGGKGVLEDVAARVDLKADSANEVLALLRATFSKQPAKVMQLFREIDQSGDGLISRKEFTLACRALSIVLPKREMMILFCVRIGTPSVNRVQSTDFEAGGVVTVRSRYQRRAISVFVKFKSKCLACLFCCPVLYAMKSKREIIRYM